MFKKLLSNLPFNPSLIGQVSFYAKRMHREATIRRAGLVLVALAFFVQFFAFISPPQPTLAESTNDIIRGGFTSRDQAVQVCRSNTGNFADILQYYKVSCDTLANAETVNINSTDYNNQLDSMGRTPQGPTIARTGKPTDEYAVNIAGGPYYMRNLSAWDNPGTTSTYKVLKMTGASGVTVMAMYACGNIVTVGRYTPPAPPPPPPAPKPRCPLDQSIEQADARCVPCTYNNAIIQSNPACKPPKCPLDNSINADNPRCKSCPYNSQILRDNAKCVQCPYPGLGSIGKDNPFCKEPCPYNSSLTKDSAQCKPCDKSTNQTDAAACLELHKKASNPTQHITDANNTTAQPGDVIEYSLITKNTGKLDIKNFVVQENVSDILEYADITDYHGGSLSSDKRLVSWPAATVAAGASVTNNLTVKVKNPIPSTPLSASNPGGSFDLVMTNVYGDAINIKLPPPTIKTIETAATVLPNTGPGESIATAFGLTAIVAYFFARSRLIAKELDIVKADYAEGGI